MKKTIIMSMMALLLIQIVSAASVGILSYPWADSFDNVTAGNSYSNVKLGIQPFDTVTNLSELYITFSVSGTYLSIPLEEGWYNTGQNYWFNLTLDLPKDIETGDYSDDVCAYAIGQSGTTIVEVGACYPIKYNVIEEDEPEPKKCNDRCKRAKQRVKRLEQRIERLYKTIDKLNKEIKMYKERYGI